MSAEKRVFRLVIEYDGTDYAGFQIQENAPRTIQGILERAIGKLSGDKNCRIHGAGRTDAGVHALGQVVHFETEWRIPAERLANALNGELPGDLYIRSARIAEIGFHARYSATARVYRYVILNRRAGSALLRRFTWHIREPLDLDAMRVAAMHMTGIYDFAAFGQPDAVGKSTVRDVNRLDIRKWQDCVLITVRGNAFLRSMVRAFVGTLAQAGRRRIEPDFIRTIVANRDRGLCPEIAPANGLFLARVEYDGSRVWRQETTMDANRAASDAADDESTNFE